MSSIFTQAKMASAFTAVLYLVLYVPYMYVQIEEIYGHIPEFYAKCLMVCREYYYFKGCSNWGDLK